MYPKTIIKWWGASIPPSPPARPPPPCYPPPAVPPTNTHAYVGKQRAHHRQPQPSKDDTTVALTHQYCVHLALDPPLTPAVFVSTSNPSHLYLRELPVGSGPNHAVYRSPLLPGRRRRRSERRFRRSNVTTRRAGLRQRGSRTHDHDRRVHGGARRIEVQASHRSVQLVDRFLFDCNTVGDLNI